LEAALATTSWVVRISTEMGFSHMTCYNIISISSSSDKVHEDTSSKSRARQIRGAWVAVAVEIRTAEAPLFFMHSSGVG
jgi:hypothetical protein